MHPKILALLLNKKKIIYFYSENIPKTITEVEKENTVQTLGVFSVATYLKNEKKIQERMEDRLCQILDQN